MAEHVLKDAPEKFALAGHSMGGRVACTYLVSQYAIGKTSIARHMD